MPSRQERREELRTTLIDVAERTVIASGVQTVRARDLAAEAGCAVGAIYNVFDDLTELLMAVNGRTFQRLGATVSGAVASADTDDPEQVLITMGHAYLGFASENTNVWRALFDLEMSTDQDVPTWYLEELGHLFGLISAPLAKLNPGLTAAEIDTLTRAVFSSVHGIVLLGLEKRISGVPLDEIEKMIAVVLTNFTSHRK